MRICSGSGCLRAVADDVRFCDECKPTGAQSDEIREHGNKYDAELNEIKKGTRWQRLRARVVQEQPLCARCELSITEIVDHVVPAQIAIQQARASGKYPFDRYAGFYLRSNLQGLCRPCHGAKTIEDKAHTGPWPDVVAKETATQCRPWSFG